MGIATLAVILDEPKRRPVLTPIQARHHAEFIIRLREATEMLEMFTAQADAYPFADILLDNLNQRLGEKLLAAGHAFTRMREVRECLGEG